MHRHQFGVTMVSCRCHPMSRSCSGSSSTPPRPAGETAESRRAPGRRPRGGRSAGHPRRALRSGRRDHPPARARLGRPAAPRPRRRVRRLQAGRRSGAEGPPTPRSQPVAVEDDEDGAASRTTVRLPDALKARAAEAAAAEGVSLNTWLVRTVAAAAGALAARGPRVAGLVLLGVAARMSVFAVTEPPEVRVEIQVGRVDLVAHRPRRRRRSRSRRAIPPLRRPVGRRGGTGRPGRRRRAGHRPVPAEPLRTGRLGRCPGRGARGHDGDRRREVRVGERLRATSPPAG